MIRQGKQTRKHSFRLPKASKTDTILSDMKDSLGLGMRFGKLKLDNFLKFTESVTNFGGEYGLATIEFTTGIQTGPVVEYERPTAMHGIQAVRN